MNGHKSSISTMPENSSFDHGSTSSDPVTDSQIPCNNMLTSTHNRNPDYKTSPNLQTLPPPGDRVLSAEWSLGETSSSTTCSQGENNERKQESSWPVHALPVLSLDGPHFPTTNFPPPDNNIGLNSKSTQPWGLNMQAEVKHPEQDTCQIMGNSSNMPSGSSGQIRDGEESSVGCSVDGRRISCKRKSPEVPGGESSRAAARLGPVEIGPGTNKGPEQTNSRLRLGIGGTLLPEPFSLSTLPDDLRNLCRGINGSPHISLGPTHPRDSSLSLRDHSLNLNPPPIAESGGHGGPTGPLHAPSARGNTQSRWSGPSGPRTGSSSASHEEFAPRSSTLVPSRETENLSQQPGNRNLDGNSTVGGGGSSSYSGPASNLINSYRPLWANRGRQQSSRRMSEILRRSLLASVGSSRAAQPGPSQGIPISSGPDNHGRHISGARLGLAMRQHLNSAYRLPSTLRILAASGDGRTRLMSEIRRVLDLMRSGEDLRLEDVMILNHSPLFGMASTHDHHRDMRLDIDNMSYEELLVLGERIGNVCTGLNEETIMNRLKQKPYVKGVEGTEPCSICREEYIDGEDVGVLECGHEFHRDCVKKWLVRKNLCPICRSMALTK